MVERPQISPSKPTTWSTKYLSFEPSNLGGRYGSSFFSPPCPPRYGLPAFGGSQEQFQAVDSTGICLSTGPFRAFQGATDKIRQPGKGTRRERTDLTGIPPNSNQARIFPCNFLLSLLLFLLIPRFAPPAWTSTQQTLVLTENFDSQSRPALPRDSGITAWRTCVSTSATALVS